MNRAVQLVMAVRARRVLPAPECQKHIRRIDPGTDLVRDGFARVDVDFVAEERDMRRPPQERCDEICVLCARPRVAQEDPTPAVSVANATDEFVDAIDGALRLQFVDQLLSLNPSPEPGFLANELLPPRSAEARQRDDRVLVTCDRKQLRRRASFPTTDRDHDVSTFSQRESLGNRAIGKPFRSESQHRCHARGALGRISPPIGAAWHGYHAARNVNQ